MALETNDKEITTTTTTVPEAEAEKKKILILKTSDNETFEVEESIAIQCGLIKNMVEDDCASQVIPVTNVSSKYLTKIIEYLKDHAHADSSLKEDDKKELKKKFDKNYLEGLDGVELSELLDAANYLNIYGIIDVAAQKIADTIKDMKVEEAREYFGIKNEFTPEEEEDVRKEHPWAF